MTASPAHRPFAGSLLLLLAIFGARAGTGCSSKSSPPPTGICDFAGNPDNCWRTVLTKVDACEGATLGLGTGKFSADLLSCDFGDGRSATFASAVDLTLPADRRTRDFHVLSGAKDCGHVVDRAGAIDVTSNDGAHVSFTKDAKTGGMVIVCPDGSRFSGTTAEVFENCPDHLFDLPGDTISGTSTDDRVSLFASQTAGYSCTK